jgi:FAD/FMN-containing dehydrogenase
VGRRGLGGLRGPEAEALLADRGYTIGHFPQSFEYATLGGFAAARSSGQASAGYGRFDELVMALRLATPAGALTLGRAPKSAAGPDLRQLILGSEGAFGVITSLTVSLRPAPERRVYEGQAREQGRPDNVLDRIVTGKLEAFFKDNVLLDQMFVKDDKVTIEQLVDEVSAKVGEKLQVRRFARFELGKEAE